MNTTNTQNDNAALMTTLAVIMLVTFGVTMLAFSALYVHDVQTLRALPGMIWDFLCGQPQENGIALPALVLMSTVSFMLAAGIVGGRWVQRARS